MRTGKLTKQAANWIKRNPTLGGVAMTLLRNPSPQELEMAYRLYNEDTHGLRSEMTQEDLNKYLEIIRSKQSGEY